MECGATDGCPRWLGGPVPAGSAVQGAACMKIQCKWRVLSLQRNQNILGCTIGKLVLMQGWINRFKFCTCRSVLLAADKGLVGGFGFVHVGRCY